MQKALYSLFLFCSTSTFSLAQVLPFHNYTQKDGLVSNGVNTIVQDSRGFLWFGTADGLSVYDGVAFRNYRSTDGLALDLVNCIAESKKSPGELWIGTNGGGISKFSGGSFTTIKLDSMRKANQVNVLIEDEAGTLWCGTDLGVYRVVQGKVHHLPMDEKLEHVGDIAISSDGLVWIGIDQSLLVYSPEGTLLHRIDLQLSPDAFVESMLADEHGSLWVATRDSLVFEFKKTGVKHRRRIPHGYALDIIDDEQGSLWLGTTEGLLTIAKSRFGTGDFVRYTVDNGLTNNRIEACMLDRERNLWFACQGEGLCKLANRNLYRFPLKGIPSTYNNANAIADSTGRFWVIAQDSLAEIWPEPDGDWTVQKHDLAPTNLGGTPVSLVYDAKDRLWVDFLQGGIQGYRISRESREPSRLNVLSTMREGALLPRGTERSFLVDSDDALWCSAWGIGVLVLNHREQAQIWRYGRELGLPNNAIRTIFEDSQGNIWLGGFRGGVVVIDRKQAHTIPPRRLTVTNGLADDQIRAFAEDAQGRIWIGTRYGGCFVYTDGRIDTVSVEDGLISNAVWAIAPDQGHKTWLGTTMGLQSLDARTLRPDPAVSDLIGKSVNSCGVSKDECMVYQSGWLLCF